MSRRKKSGTKPRTVVALIQDKSGSMGSRRDATISGANEYVESLRREAEGPVALTLTQFDTVVTDVFTLRLLDDIKPLTGEDYVPGGLTALHDAIGRTVRSTEAAIEDEDRVLVVIMTDGQENSSVEWTKDGILKLLADKRKDGWEFIFLGAGEEAWASGHSLGFNQTNSYTYTGDAHDHQAAVADIALATASVTQGRTARSYLAVSETKTSLEKKAKARNRNAAIWKN